MKIKEIQCKSALAKCGFPSGGLAINPYVGCGHGCVYCYARFMKKFTGHNEEWGSFIDVRTNIADILEKEIKSPKFKGQAIHIGTVTDPYQPIEKKYQLTREILEILSQYNNPVSILTKSDMVLRDIDLIKQFKDIDVNFTVNTLDEKWREISEPNAPTIEQRLLAMKTLSKEGIRVIAMMGPFWPFFTDPEKLFKEFKNAGVSHVFSESLNTIGQNWLGVEKAVRKYYPDLLLEMQVIFSNPKNFCDFYQAAKEKIDALSQQYRIPVTAYFGLGHAAKFKK